MDPRRHFLWVISYRCFTLWLAAATVENSSIAVRTAPIIVKQPLAKEILFRVAESEQDVDEPFVIECQAKGNPRPFYRWYKNGTEFKWQDNFDRIYQRARRGTLIFVSPRDEDAGEYQCQARNRLGTAISHAVIVRKVESGSLDAIQNIQLVEAKEGEPFKLKCVHAGGRLKPKVFWNLVDYVGGISSLNASRITVDPTGDLWFSHVTQEDASIDFFYACVALYLSPTGNKSKTETYALPVIPTNNSIHQPVAQYVTNGRIVALQGDDVDIWCIVGGTPLPQIVWKKESRTLLSSYRIKYDSFGKTLRIKKVQLRDAGTYVCTASNGIGTPVTNSVNIEVYGEAEECHRMVESDNGTLEIEPSSTSCLWIIKLQNKTGFHLELDPLMREPILVIPEHNIFDSNLRSVWITGAEEVYGEFEGKLLAIMVPRRREKTTLNWTGLAEDNSGVSFSTKLMTDIEGTLEWKPADEGTYKILWAFELGVTGQLNWTLNTVNLASNPEHPCDSIYLAVLEIRMDGNISEIEKTCDGSSSGYLMSENSSQVLILLHLKSVKETRSSLEVTWKHLGVPLKKNVEGILAGTDRSGALVIPFNSSQTRPVSSGIVNGSAAGPEVHGRQEIENFMKVACSKKAIGSLVLALESSNNKRILAETYDWLQTSPARKKNYPISLKSLARQPRATATGLFAATEAGIISLDLRTLDVTSLMSDLPLAVAVNRNLKKVYWSTGGNSRIMRSNFDGSAKEIIVSQTGSSIFTLAIDEPSGDVYFARNGSHEITVCNAVGQNRVAVISNPSLVNFLVAIALDSDKGLMYWGNRPNSSSHSLVRANMDGSNAAIISTGFKNLYGIILDKPSNDVLYWADLKENVIGTIHANGGDKRTLLKLEGNSGPSGIQVDAQKIYFGNYNGKNIQSVDKGSGKELTTIFNSSTIIRHLALFNTHA